MGDCQARFRERGGWKSLHLLDTNKDYDYEKADADNGLPTAGTGNKGSNGD